MLCCVPCQFSCRNLWDFCLISWAHTHRVLYLAQYPGDATARQKTVNLFVDLSYDGLFKCADTLLLSEIMGRHTFSTPLLKSRVRNRGRQNAERRWSYVRRPLHFVAATDDWLSLVAAAQRQVASLLTLTSLDRRCCCVHSILANNHCIIRQ